MKTPLNQKSTIHDIQQRFDADVERFSNLETGQQAIVDAALVLEMMARAAASCAPQAKTVLDIGCGAGNNTLKLLQFLHPLDCDLVDLSKPMLNRAKERIKAKSSGQIRLFQGDFRTIDLPHGHYDVIIAAAVLHHLREDRDWEETFAKIFRSTAPGGWVWISDMVSHESAAVQDIMWERYGLYLESLGGKEYREKVFTYIEKEDSPRSITFQMDLLRRVGFVKVDVLHKNACFAAFGGQKRAE